MNELLRLRLQKFGDGVAEDCAERAIDLRPGAVGVYLGHADRSVVERAPPLSLLLLREGAGLLLRGDGALVQKMRPDLARERFHALPLRERQRARPSIENADRAEEL